MATNTISCDWLSSTEIVGDVAARKLSVADIVSQCANVCEAVFESRGPAGVSISFTRYSYVADYVFRI